jgi:TIR domain/Effector-associated domain 11
LFIQLLESCQLSKSLINYNNKLIPFSNFDQLIEKPKINIQMTLKELKEKVHDHIKNARTKEAMDDIGTWAHEHNQEQLKRDLTLLIGDYSQFKKDDILGYKSPSETDAKRNQLNNRVLNLLDSIKDKTDNSSGSGRMIRKSMEIPADFTGEIVQTIIAVKGELMSNIGRHIEHKPKVYFSYAWGDDHEIGESREKIVGELYESLKKDGYDVFKDKEDSNYRDLISDMMKNIGKGKFIVVAISDKYLKSPNCMFELYEIYRNSQLEKDKFLEKIFPIRVESIRLSDPKVLDVYFEYWEQQEKEWAELIIKRGTRISPAQHERYKRIKTIAAELGEFLEILSDMNTKTKDDLSENNFEEIKKAIAFQMSI